jgi:hypothetical protein
MPVKLGRASSNWRFFVSGWSKSAKEGRMKTSPFKGCIALSAAGAAQGSDEHTHH